MPRQSDGPGSADRTPWSEGVQYGPSGTLPASRHADPETAVSAQLPQPPRLAARLLAAAASLALACAMLAGTVAAAAAGRPIVSAAPATGAEGTSGPSAVGAAPDQLGTWETFALPGASCGVPEEESPAVHRTGLWPEWRAGVR